MWNCDSLCRCGVHVFSRSFYISIYSFMLFFFLIFHHDHWFFFRVYCRYENDNDDNRAGCLRCQRSVWLKPTLTAPPLTTVQLCCLSFWSQLQYLSRIACIVCVHQLQNANHFISYHLITFLFQEMAQHNKKVNKQMKPALPKPVIMIACLSFAPSYVQQKSVLVI